MREDTKRECGYLHVGGVELNRLCGIFDGRAVALEFDVGCPQEHNEESEKEGRKRMESGTRYQRHDWHTKSLWVQFRWPSCRPRWRAETCDLHGIGAKRHELINPANAGTTSASAM